MGVVVLPLVGQWTSNYAHNMTNIMSLRAAPAAFVARAAFVASYASLTLWLAKW